MHTPLKRSDVIGSVKIKIEFRVPVLVLLSFHSGFLERGWQALHGIGMHFKMERFKYQQRENIDMFHPHPDFEMVRGHLLTSRKKGRKEKVSPALG